jgi:hypothetical protein
LGGVPVPANDAGILTWALYASSLSFYVFPLRKGTKKPARERWQADSTRDEATIRGWFSGNDYDGYLIDCGKSNIAVADWDCNTFEEYIAARRKLNLPTAPTFRVQSGRVGFGAHEYYSCAIPTRNFEFGTVKSTGGYVCGPGTVHEKSGVPYRVMISVTLLPSTILTSLLPPEEKTHFEPGELVSKNHRHAFLMSEAAKIRNMNLSPETSFQMLRAICDERCESPEEKTDSELASMIGWTMTKEGNTAPLPVIGAESTASASSVPPENTSTVLPTVDPAVFDNDEAATIESLTTPEEVIRGVYKKGVDWICRGNTLPRGYVFNILKTLDLIRCAGRVTFDIIVNPRYILILLGPTNAGKGSCMLRVRQAFGRVTGETWNFWMSSKLCQGIDSGVGLIQMFFDKGPRGSLTVPAISNVVLFVDEVKDLGNKAGKGKEEAIMTAILQLTDNTIASRRIKGIDIENDHANFAAVMGGQPQTANDVFSAIAKEIGWYPRCYPVFSEVPDVKDDIPALDMACAEAKEFRVAWMMMPTTGNMSMSREATELRKSFWNELPRETQDLARLKDHINADAFAQARSQSRTEVNVQDMADAILQFKVQEAVRKEHFNPAKGRGDDTAKYLGEIKKIVARLVKQRKRHAALEKLAMTETDYCIQTGADAVNEDHLFARAWAVYKSRMKTHAVQDETGATIEKWLPKEIN